MYGNRTFSTNKPIDRNVLFHILRVLHATRKSFDVVPNHYKASGAARDARRKPGVGLENQGGGMRSRDVYEFNRAYLNAILDGSRSNREMTGWALRADVAQIAELEMCTLAAIEKIAGGSIAITKPAFTALDLERSGDAKNSPVVTMLNINYLSLVKLISLQDAHLAKVSVRLSKEQGDAVGELSLSQTMAAANANRLLFTFDMPHKSIRKVNLATRHEVDSGRDFCLLSKIPMMSLAVQGGSK